MKVVFNVGAPVVQTMQPLLDALVAQDVAYLLAHPRTPPLYQSGVRYQREPKGQENWRTIPEVLRARWGDCEDLAAWRTAELRVRSSAPARVFPVAVSRGPLTLVHILVSRDGLCSLDSIEDPSVHLGMPPIPEVVLEQLVSSFCSHALGLGGLGGR